MMDSQRTRFWPLKWSIMAFFLLIFSPGLYHISTRATRFGGIIVHSQMTTSWPPLANPGGRGPGPHPRYSRFTLRCRVNRYGMMTHHTHRQMINSLGQTVKVSSHIRGCSVIPEPDIFHYPFFHTETVWPTAIKFGSKVGCSADASIQRMPVGTALSTKELLLIMTGYMICVNAMCQTWIRLRTLSSTKHLQGQRVVQCLNWWTCWMIQKFSFIWKWD